MAENHNQKDVIENGSRSSKSEAAEERFIVVPMYGPVGLGNQWISTQLATVLAFLTGRTLVLDLDGGFQPSGKMMFAHSGSGKHSDLQITDMFDLPVPMLVCRQKGELENWLAQYSDSTYTPAHWPSCFLDATIQVGKVEPPDSFKHRRTKHMLHMSDLTVRQERVIRMRRWVRGSDRSTFYFSQANTLFYHECPGVRAEIARVVASIQPRPEFLAVARAATHTRMIPPTTDLSGPSTGGDISGEYSLFPKIFDAVHLRRGDLKLSFIQNATAKQLEKRIRGEFGDNDDVPILLSTDAPKSKIVKDLQALFPTGRLVLCDDWLRPLTNNDDMVAHAYVCLLMCTFARNFLGTPGSTFTNLVQHRRAIHGSDKRIEYVYAHKDPPFEEWSWSPRGHPHEIGWFSVPTEDWSLLVSDCEFIQAGTQRSISTGKTYHPPFLPPLPPSAAVAGGSSHVVALPSAPKLAAAMQYKRPPSKSHRAWPPMNGDPAALVECQRLLDDFKVDLVVETGSLYGDTAKWFAETDSSRPVYTIEVAPEISKIARETLAKCKNATAIRGSSDEVLTKKLPEWVHKYKRVLFYLDTHWQNHALLHRELAAIAHSCYDCCILVIDDVQVPGKPDVRFDSDGDEVKTWDMMRDSVLACYSPNNCKWFYHEQMVGKLYVVPSHLYAGLSG